MYIKNQALTETNIQTRVKAFLKETPLYRPLKKIRDYLSVFIWYINGKPATPPHLIKQMALREIAKRFKIKILVEKGTYYGDMIDAMKKHFDIIYSIELSQELHDLAQKRFDGDQKIHLIQGDSGKELGKIMDSLSQPALFWLDGHYSGGETAKGELETPIYQELSHILNAKEQKHIILIDDARCFGTNPSYPTLEDITAFVKKHKNAEIAVKNDIIRIFL